MQHTIDLLKREINETQESIDKMYSEREELIQRMSDIQIIINKRRSTQISLKRDLRSLCKSESESLKMSPNCDRSEPKDAGLKNASFNPDCDNAKIKEGRELTERFFHER